MLDDESDLRDNSLDHAVNLAAWLIRTGRQPPQKANFIAARRYAVDMAEVARIVGTRGGRRAAKLRREGVQHLKPAQDLGDHQSSRHEQVDCEVLEIDNGGARFPLTVRLRLRPVGAHAAEVLEADVPHFRVMAVTVGDVVEVGVVTDASGSRLSRLPNMLRAKRRFSEAQRRST